MVISNLRRLRFEKEERDKVKLTFERLAEETGLSKTTINRLLKQDVVIDRIDGATLDALCRYFDCQVGDILVYVPGEVEEETKA